MTAHNPFAPPSSDLTDLPMDDSSIRKPRSVWVVQFVGGFLAALCAFGLAVIARKAIGDRSYTGYGIPIGLHLFVQTCFVALLLLMLWQLRNRSRFGRNLGLGLIVFFAIPTAVVIFLTPTNGSSQFVGTLLATAIFEAPLIYWAYAFAFSEKARRYFSTAGNG